MVRSGIGVFDSGVGGLTVLRELVRALPHERFFYLGDTARVPYGTKSAATVIRYAENAAGYLDRLGVGLIVVACNTASAVAGSHLSRTLPVPVVNVIRPAAEEAALRSRSRRIGVIGTSTTIASGAYPAVLHEMLPEAEVVMRACPLFVPLAEEGIVDGEIATLVARRYLSDLPATGIDTLILGCTHYPLLRETIVAAVGPGIAIVDSAETAAATVRRIVEAGRTPEPALPPGVELVFTDASPHFVETAKRFFGGAVGRVELVDL